MLYNHQNLKLKTTIKIFFLVLSFHFSNGKAISHSNLEVAFGNDSFPQRKITGRILLNVGVYGGSMAGLYQTWYKNYPQTKLHSFNDWDEWKQMDKVGHVYSAYTMSRFGREIWRNSGLNNKQQIWIGGLTGVVYQTVIETLDGFSEAWGWSWGDFGANFLGSGIYVSQALMGDEQLFLIKTSFHPTHYDDEVLNQRSKLLFGKSLPERFLKDYNGQTYWLSMNVKKLVPNSKVPVWLNVAVGYGADGMFGARSNIWKNADGSELNRSEIKRSRQWYLAPDVDFTKIKTRKKWVKAALFVANSLKFPAPALELNRGKLKMNWLYF